MAKPVEGRVVAAHFGYCVLSVVCCVVTSFSFLTGRKAKIVQAKMATFSALITKNASLDAPIIKECPKLPSSLDLGHFFVILAHSIRESATNAEKVCYFFNLVE
jgi:hypothetical protein